MLFIHICFLFTSFPKISNFWLDHFLGRTFDCSIFFSTYFNRLRGATSIWISNFPSFKLYPFNIFCMISELSRWARNFKTQMFAKRTRHLQLDSLQYLLEQNLYTSSLATTDRFPLPQLYLHQLWSTSD